MAKNQKHSLPEAVSAIIDRQFKENHKEDHLYEYQIWKCWKDIVGETLAQKSAPKSLERGRLIIMVKDAAWMTQLKFMTMQIRNAINRALQKNIVKEIYCNVGELPQTPSDNPKPQIKDRPLTPAEEEKIADAIQFVADPRVKTVVRDIMRKQFLTGER